ncbi:hypothetical protein A2U01_0107063, partial [Trifolium medium]|nr:hypothetical protein [Trifolium medium]
VEILSMPLSPDGGAVAAPISFHGGASTSFVRDSSCGN